MKVRIGTRKSKLAIAQTEMVINEIKRKFPDAHTEIVYITTSGDKILDKPLTEIGGKGIFVSEIESALLDGSIDIAVHSAKDLPISLADGLAISGDLKRGDHRDALITNRGTKVETQASFTAGTSSARRRVELSKLYPNVIHADIRGNVDTRLNKLADRQYDAIILAMAGLHRLSLDTDDRFDIIPFEYDRFLPAPCQGIIAIETRKNDSIVPIIEEITDRETWACFETERAIIKALNADCSVPLGAYSFIDNDRIKLFISKSGAKTVSGESAISAHLQLSKELIECL